MQLKRIKENAECFEEQLWAGYFLVGPLWAGLRVSSSRAALSRAQSIFYSPVQSHFMAMHIYRNTRNSSNLVDSFVFFFSVYIWCVCVCVCACCGWWQLLIYDWLPGFLGRLSKDCSNCRPSRGTHSAVKWKRTTTSINQITNTNSNRVRNANVGLE